MPEFLLPFILLPGHALEMDIEVKSLAIPAAAVIAYVFLLTLMEIQMLLKVALLREAHVAAVHGAFEWLVLGVAP